MMNAESVAYESKAAIVFDAERKRGKVLWLVERTQAEFFSEVASA